MAVGRVPAVEHRQRARETPFNISKPVSGGWGVGFRDEIPGEMERFRKLSGTNVYSSVVPALVWAIPRLLITASNPQDEDRSGSTGVDQGRMTEAER